jgi:colicin import membrane protein
VVGGSTRNKVGGAGGKALKTDNDDVLGAYYAMFKQRLRAEFLPPPGLSDSLKATIEASSHPDGSLSNARIIKSSGSTEFDDAVLEAIKRVRMPARPDRKTESFEFFFAMRERNEG